MQSDELNALVTSVIQRIAVGPNRGRDITALEARQVTEALLAGQLNDVQAAVILIALRMKREAQVEFQGMAEALQAQVSTVQVDLDDVFTLADPYDGYLRCYPMTPFLPAVLAACDVAVVHTGVESVGPKNGVTAHQVLALAGYDVLASVSNQAQVLQQCGWAYCAQECFSPKLYSLHELRGKIIKRTALTTLERALMPVQGRKMHLVLGYVHREYPSIYAAIAMHLGYSSALLFKGVEGGLAPALNKPLRFSLTVQEAAKGGGAEGASIPPLSSFNVPPSITADVAACLPAADGELTAASTLEIGQAVLDGERTGAILSARNSLCLAAATILFAHQRADSLEQAVEKVQNCLDNGSARARFNAPLA